MTFFVLDWLWSHIPTSILWTWHHAQSTNRNLMELPAAKDIIYICTTLQTRPYGGQDVSVPYVSVPTRFGPGRFGPGRFGPGRFGYIGHNNSSRDATRDVLYCVLYFCTVDLFLLCL